MKSAFLKFLTAATFALAFAAPSYADFSGPYAFPWTTTSGPDGTGGTTVDTSGGPSVLQFLGGDLDCANNGGCIVRYSVAVAGTGNITFDWAASTGDFCCEIFGYGVDSILTTLWDAGTSGSPGGGSESVPVVLGNTFEFWYDCDDCILGPGEASVRSFNGPDEGAVPEPATLALLGISLLGLGVSRRRARRS